MTSKQKPAGSGTEMEQRRVFISFLGIGKYTECNYELEPGKKVETVRFIQEALVRLLCADFDEDDRILIFLTDKAREKNWRDSESGQGLAARLAACGNRGVTQDISIADGVSADELWRIFDVVFRQFRTGDRVVFDITHGFRSLPMLGMVLLNYARLLKDISIDGIYYGAFEVLGPAYKVKEIPLADRNAPIFDLTDFATLLEWTSGVQEFVRHGNPTGIAELLKSEARPRLSHSRGKDEAALLMRDTGGCLEQIAGQIMTCRGLKLVDGKSFTHLQNRLQECAAIQGMPEPFLPMMEQIGAKVEPFGQNEAENCLRAVRWCIEHNLVQQGLTLLMEGVVSMMAINFGLSWKKLGDRELLSELLHVVGQKVAEENWTGSLRQQPEKARQMAADPLITGLAPVFDRLSKARNDINHGGFREPKDAKTLRLDLKYCCEDVESILAQHCKS